MPNIDLYMEQLTRMEIKPEALKTALDILEAVPQIQTELENPAVAKEKKRRLYKRFSRRQQEHFY